MASLKCSKCGYGIHYHGEADGTQTILFREEVWNNLTYSDMIVSRYTLDGTNDYLTIWKCKECESIYLFQGMTTKVFRAYQLIHKNVILDDSVEKYIGFIDIDWDIITEESIRGEEIFDKFPECKPLKVDISEQYLIMYNSDEPSKPHKVYERIEIEKV